MGADLFESYVNSIIAAMAIGAALFGGKGITFPMLLAAVGILASLIGTFFVRIKEKGDPQLALRKGTFATGILMIVGSFLLTRFMFADLALFWSVLAGVICGVAIGLSLIHI